MDSSFFSDALEIANSSSSTVTKDRRSAAESYLMALQSSPEGLSLSFDILTCETFPISSSRFFWAMNTILYHLPSLAGTLEDRKAEEIYQKLIECIQRYFLASVSGPSCFSGVSSFSNSSSINCTSGTVGDYIFNKHAQAMVTGFQLFFPFNQWGSFLFDLIEMRRRAQGQIYEDQVTMYILRVLECIDERVVSVRDRADRLKEQRDTDMQIKDAMRETVIPEFVQMWYDILVRSQSSRRPQMIFVCLDVVKMYTEWIDISLLLHDHWIQLLYYHMSLPLYRESVCECLLSLVNKKQLPELKYETLLRLKIIEEMPKFMEMVREDCRTNSEQANGSKFVPAGTLDYGLHAGLQDGEKGKSGFAAAVTSLFTAITSQVLTLADFFSGCLQQQTCQDRQDVQQSADNVLQALHLLVSYLIQLTASMNIQLPIDEVINVFQLYVKTAYFLYEEAEALMDPLFKRTILFILLHEGPDAVWDEGIIESRKSIHLVIRLIYRRFPETVSQHLQKIVWCATARNELQEPPPFISSSSDQPYGLSCPETFDLNNQNFLNDSTAYYFFASAPFLEATLRYIYEMGSAVKLETLRDFESPLSQVIERILSVGFLCFFTPLFQPEMTNTPFRGPGMRSEDVLPLLYGRFGYSHGCGAVHLGFFETLYRYHQYFIYRSDNLQNLLEIMLLKPYGVSHPHEKTRGRICSLLRQLILALLNPNAGGHGSAMSPLLPYSMDMVKVIHSISSVATFSRGPEKKLLPNDCCELYEGMGMLLSLSAISPLWNKDDDVSLIHERYEKNFVGCQELLRVITASLLEKLGASRQGVENLISSSNFVVQKHSLGSSPNGETLPEDDVADCLSFCSAWAKGLRLGITSSHSGPSLEGIPFSQLRAGGAFSASPSAEWQQFTAAMLASMLHAIGPIWETFHFSSVIREKTGTFFGQLINTIPMSENTFEIPLQNYLVASVTPSKESTSPADLNRTLRLLHQLIGKAGKKAVNILLHLIPLIWNSMKSSVGPLPPASGSNNSQLIDSTVGESFQGREGTLRASSDAEPRSEESLLMGVISENFRERLEVYKNYFLLLNNAATFNCSAAFLDLPEQAFEETFSQLQGALFLPAEMDVPKQSLQLFSRLLGEPHAINVSVPSEENKLLDPPSIERLRQPLLYSYIPAAFTAFTAHTFDWKDAKNSLLCIEFSIFAHAVVKRFSDEALEAFFSSLSPYVGGEAAQSWCVMLRDEAKVTPAIKSQLRLMLSQIQQFFLLTHPQSAAP